VTLDELPDLAHLSAEHLDGLPYGVIQLDATGKILAFNRTEGEMAYISAYKAIGRNFFTEIAPCTDVKEFRGRFDSFLKSTKQSERFYFTYKLPHRTIEVELLFVRVGQSLAFLVSKKMES
jgi:photoactive yellow protein